MSRNLIDDFYWSDIEEQKGEKLNDKEKYKRIVSWAGKARGQNPSVFDALTEWVLDDSEWSDEKFAENEQILMQGVFYAVQRTEREASDIFVKIRAFRRS